MDVGSLVTRLIMDATNFDSTINRSQREINAFRVRAENVGRGVNSVFNGISGAALKLVPAIAAGTTALGAFNKVLKSSGSLSDSFDKIALQVGSSIDYIASRAAELDFHNAIDGLKESLKIAGQLADVLDRIGTTDTYKAYEDEVLNKLLDRERRAREDYQLNPTKENKAKLNAATNAVIEQQTKVNNKHYEQLKNQNDKIGTLKYSIANKAGFANDKRATQIAEILAKDQRLLDMSQDRYKKFNNKMFKNSELFMARSGVNILSDYSWEDLNAKEILKKEFKSFFEKATGLKFTKHNYEEQRRFITISNLEGLEEGGDLTELTNAFTERERLIANNEAANAQIAREQRKSNDKIDKNNNKVNTKLTNTNETLEEINKKFSDAKDLLLLQKNEGYLDKESYLKELLKTTDNYIAKLYDPIYANVEGIKDLRSAAISSAKDIENQLKNLNKPRVGFNFGNSNFNLINSNLYRQLEKLITLQLGYDDNKKEEYGSEDVAKYSANSRALYSKLILNGDDGTNFSNVLGHITDINKKILLNYEKVLATIIDNDKDLRFLGLSPGEGLSTIFDRAFGGSNSRAGTAKDEIPSDSVYEFLRFVRIMSALPSDMVNTFKEEWIRLNKNPELFISKGYDSALPLALKSVPDASKYINTELSPISEIQNTRKKAGEELGVSREDLDSYYKQSAPILDTKDLVEKIDAFKSFNNLSDLDFFNNSNLESIDKELQTKLSAFKILMKNLLDGRKNLEDELKRNTKIEYDENGKEIGERDLTEDEINDLNNQINGIDFANKTYRSYIDKLERAQIDTQKLIQISQVFNIKQKEIKENFDNFRSISSSIGEITNAFSDLDGKVGEFARTLNALNNFANIVANLVEKLELLKEAQKAAKIAAEATGVAINGETTATTTNTAATAANSAAKTTSATTNDTSATSTTTDTTAKTTNTAATIANTAATTTDTAVSTAKTAANVGEAASEGTKQASKLPFPANIGAIAAVLAAIGGAAATISSLSRKKYATGGIVTGPGSSFSDSIPISVSNGEMILNKSQQRNLFDLLNYGGGSSRGGGTSEVNFKILGENLVGSINNRNKGRNKIL